MDTFSQMQSNPFGSMNRSFLWITTAFHLALPVKMAELTSRCIRALLHGTGKRFFGIQTGSFFFWAKLLPKGNKASVVAANN
jgi:hypothetical protein